MPGFFIGAGRCDSAISTTLASERSRRRPGVSDVIRDSLAFAANRLLT
jgi:hypothetical protein